MGDNEAFPLWEIRMLFFIKIIGIACTRAIIAHFRKLFPTSQFSNLIHAASRSWFRRFDTISGCCDRTKLYGKRLRHISSKTIIGVIIPLSVGHFHIRRSGFFLTVGSKSNRFPFFHGENIHIPFNHLIPDLSKSQSGFLIHCILLFCRL